MTDKKDRTFPLYNIANLLCQNERRDSFRFLVGMKLAMALQRDDKVAKLAQNSKMIQSSSHVCQHVPGASIADRKLFDCGTPLVFARPSHDLGRGNNG